MIKNLIIDFGGVLFEIAPERTLKRLNSIGNTDYTYTELADMAIFKKYETASISTSEFIDSIRDIFNIPVETPDKSIINAWNETLIGIFPFAISTISRLKRNYNIALLSNTNQLHYEFFAPICQELFSIFDKCYFSHQIMMRKPNTDIYKFVLSNMGYKSNETIFIDDSIANLKGAEAAGLHTFRVSPDTLVSDFPDTV